jgi:hypothetical protein
LNTILTTTSTTHYFHLLKIIKTVNSIFMLSIHCVWALSSLHQFKLHVLKTLCTVLVLHVGTSKVSMSGANVMNMLQTTHLDLLYFSFRWFSLNSFHYQYNDYYHFYGLLVCHIFEILSYTHVPIFSLCVCFSSNNILLVFVFIFSFVHHTFDVSGFMTWLLILCYNFYFLNEV